MATQNRPLVDAVKETGERWGSISKQRGSNPATCDADIVL